MPLYINLVDGKNFILDLCELFTAVKCPCQLHVPATLGQIVGFEERDLNEGLPWIEVPVQENQAQRQETGPRGTPCKMEFSFVKTSKIT